MSDIEDIVTTHLDRAAARAVPRPDLDSVLAAGPSPSPPLGRTTPRRRWATRVGVAAAALVIVGVVAVTQRSGETTVDTSVREQPSTTPSTLPTSTASSIELTARRAPAESGFAVVRHREIRLYDLSGTLVAEGRDAAATEKWSGPLVVSRQAHRALSIVEGSVGSDYAARGLAPGEACAELDRSSLGSVFACRPNGSDSFGRQLVHVAPDGTRRILVGAVYPGDVYPGTSTQVGGHWARAFLSPDGQWIAAQWSGECEVPTAFLVRVADGAVFGPTAAPLAPRVEDWPAESSVLGWDGASAVVVLFQDECGSAPRSAVMSVDPVRGSSTELVALATEDGIVSDRVLTWRLRR